MNYFSEKGADRRFEVPAGRIHFPVKACQRQVQTSQIKIVLTEEPLK